MPTPLTGSVRCQRGRWAARVTIATGSRLSFALTTCEEHDQEKAEARGDLLADLGRRLRKAGHAELAASFLERAAARDGKALEDVVRAVHKLCSGEAAAPISAATTFREFGQQWTSGKLHERWPDHVKKKSTAADDEKRLALYVYPIVGDVPLPIFTISDADRVMSSLPPRLSGASRRHVAQVLARLLKLAAYPARLIPVSPIPGGFLPSVGKRKALSFLYPDEDAKLLACAAIPLPYRVLYGVLNREGMRRSEAARLVWGDLDAERGALTLDKNKTDDPRAWAMTPGVARAFAAWRRLRERRGGRWRDTDHVFVDKGGASVAKRGDDRECIRLREHLQLAGIARAELFEKSETRQPIRMHDLRATFVTVALANGRSETWVADRTGHSSSMMINRYRRAARSIAELGLGDLLPLDEAIPELRAAPPSVDPEPPAGPPEFENEPRDQAPDQGPSGPTPRSEPSRPVLSTDEKAIRGDGLERLGSWRTRTSSQWIKSPTEHPPTGAFPGCFAGSETPNATDCDEWIPIEAASAPIAGPSLRGHAVRLLGRLSGELGALGDLHAARVLHEALGRLLDVEPVAGEERAPVLELAAHRRGRDGDGA